MVVASRRFGAHGFVHGVVQTLGDRQTQHADGQAARPRAAVVGIDSHAAVRGEQQARVRPIGLLRLVGNYVARRERHQADLSRMVHLRRLRALEQRIDPRQQRVERQQAVARGVPDSVIAMPPV